ncbi:hypothetical protein KEJ39_02665, partial [Candidatus Bathyarchaeota archaeon]|nr:hypothetical protein [Candidatus Bathyarchaeota archaeon]
MSEAPKKSGVTRRGFVRTAGAGIIGLAVGAGLGYSAATSMAPAGGPAATVTVTGPSAVSFPF